jgi:drug/metabolite transporter (DMT)-like permease
MMMGVAAALASAGLWAVTNLLVRLGAARLNVVALNSYRALVGGACFLLVFLLTRDPAEVTRLPPGAVAALLASVVSGLVFGELFNFKAMTLIGLSRAFPIASSYPLFALALAAIWLGEPFGWREVLGATTTVLGVILVALPTAAAVAADRPLDRRTNLIGVGLALAAGLCWAGSSTIVKLGLTEIDPVTANAIRQPVAAAILALLLVRVGPVTPPWRLRGRTLAIVLATGILGSGLSGFFWLYSVTEIGAGRAAVLSSTSPIFAVPLALIWLREKLAARVLIGTLLSVLGIALIVL